MTLCAHCGRRVEIGARVCECRADSNLAIVARLIASGVPIVTAARHVRDVTARARRPS